MMWIVVSRTLHLRAGIHTLGGRLHMPIPREIQDRDDLLTTMEYPGCSKRYSS